MKKVILSFMLKCDMFKENNITESESIELIKSTFGDDVVTRLFDGCYDIKDPIIGGYTHRMEFVCRDQDECDALMQYIFDNLKDIMKTIAIVPIKTTKNSFFILR